jgi:hypothetical protein
LTAWNTARRSNACLRQRIAEARDDWARLRHAQHAAAVYSSQSTRAANRKALKPQPTRQAKLVAWHLTFRVPLNFAAIPESDIKQTRERFGMSLDTWQRQKHAFGLLKKCMRNEQSFAESNTASTVVTAGEVSSHFASAFADSLRVYGGKFRLRSTKGAIPIPFCTQSLVTFFSSARWVLV